MLHKDPYAEIWHHADEFKFNQQMHQVMKSKRTNQGTDLTVLKQSCCLHSQAFNFKCHSQGILI